MSETKITEYLIDIWIYLTVYENMTQGYIHANKDLSASVVSVKRACKAPFEDEESTPEYNALDHIYVCHTKEYQKDFGSYILFPN